MAYVWRSAICDYGKRFEEGKKSPAIILNGAKGGSVNCQVGILMDRDSAEVKMQENNKILYFVKITVNPKFKYRGNQTNRIQSKFVRLFTLPRAQNV